jgi:hypothetical protein
VSDQSGPHLPCEPCCSPASTCQAAISSFLWRLRAAGCIRTNEWCVQPRQTIDNMGSMLIRPLMASLSHSSQKSKRHCLTPPRRLSCLSRSLSHSVLRNLPRRDGQERPAIGDCPRFRTQEAGGLGLGAALSPRRDDGLSQLQLASPHNPLYNGIVIQGGAPALRWRAPVRQTPHADEDRAT